ncbi:MAG: NAD(P)H-hydrate dehydratase [Candidatus ainarchaeum sp.]|nr:NAD(P)H-hydrate dehydratase [Candidatus ainarchaeum sp.]
MNCSKITKSIFKKLKKRSPKSHKCQNGLVLIIAGSKQYQGSLVFSAKTASRLADLIFACTAKENIPIIKKISPELIVHPMKDSLKLAEKADSILIGPGLEKNQKNKLLIKKILKKFWNKKTILDATALRLISPENLHSNCCVTPHAKEFLALFHEKPSKKTVFRNAQKNNCIIVAKSPIDFISNGKKIFCNSTGNPGMTTGGTGDTLAGLIAGFAAKNSLLESALAACYLNGFAGDLLFKERGFMFNAEDLMEKLPIAYKKLSA